MGGGVHGGALPAGAAHSKALPQEAPHLAAAHPHLGQPPVTRHTDHSLLHECDPTLALQAEGFEGCTSEPGWCSNAHEDCNGLGSGLGLRLWGGVGLGKSSMQMQSFPAVPGQSDIHHWLGM